METYPEFEEIQQVCSSHILQNGGRQNGQEMVPARHHVCGVGSERCLPPCPHVHPKVVRNPDFDLFKNVFLPPPPPLRVVEKPDNDIGEPDHNVTFRDKVVSEPSSTESLPRYPSRHRKMTEPLNIATRHGKSYY